MSIEYDVFILRDSFDELAVEVSQILNTKWSWEVKNRKSLKTSWSSISIDQDSYDWCNDKDLTYGSRTKYHIGIETDSSREAKIQIVNFIDKLLSKSSNDLILEFNGEFPVIISKGGKVLVNHEYDDGTNFPFDKLSMTVEVIRISCQ